MADIMSAEKRSRLMSRIRGTDTTPEKYLLALLKAAELRFTQHDSHVAGKPDFVFLTDRVVVFVDGDFWHGWRFPVWRHKLSKKWERKIEGNRQRDAAIRRRLKRDGWKILRIWEHQIEQDVMKCFERIVQLLSSEDPNREGVAARLNTLRPLKRRNRLPKP